MNSKIIVEMDFDKKEPYLQINLEPLSGVLADKTLRYFIERANHSGIEVRYPERYPDALNDNNSPQIRLKKEENNDPEFFIADNSQAFRKWLDDNEIDYRPAGHSTQVLGEINLFNLGVKWGVYKLNNEPRP